MKTFAMNLALALIWAAATGRAGAANLLLGFCAGYLALWWLSPILGGQTYFRFLPKVLRFLLFVLREIVLCNLRVAWDVVTPRAYRRPGIVAVPLDARTDEEITILANLVTLTPGTVSLEISPDRRVLYVHAMFAEDPEAIRREVKQEYERRVLDLLRGPMEGEP